MISFQAKHILSRVDTVARSFVVTMSAENAAASPGLEGQEEEQAEEAAAADSRGEDNGIESDGKSDDCTELAEEISEIVERVAASEFPPVLPCQQRCKDVANASDVLSWVEKAHHVQISSYVAEAYAAYRSVAMKPSNKAEKVFYAEWIRDTYYVHLKNFYKADASDSKVVDALVLFFGSSDTTTTLQHEIETASKVMQESHLIFFRFCGSSVAS